MQRPLKYHAFAGLSIQNPKIHSDKRFPEENPEQHSECQKGAETQRPAFPVFGDQAQEWRGDSAIRKLEAEGVLYLENAGARAKNACLTDVGRAVAERTAMRIQQIENDILACWSEEELETYLRLTEQFLVKFRERTAQL